jgi:hypothetical protein
MDHILSEYFLVRPIFVDGEWSNWRQHNQGFDFSAAWGKYKCRLLSAEWNSDLGLVL